MKVFVTAGIHFNSKNIIKYCYHQFKNAKEMNEAIIKNCNKVVGKHDIVYNLGNKSRFEKNLGNTLGTML